MASIEVSRGEAEEEVAMRYTQIAVVDIAAVHNRRAMRRGKASAAE